MLWVLCAAFFVLLLVVLAFMPVRAQMHAQGRGDPTGAWAMAGGLQVGPLALSAVGAAGVEPVAHAHLFGRQIWTRRLSELRRRESMAEKESTDLLERYENFERWFDSSEVARFAFGERRRLRLTTLEIDLEYSFMDVALTGKVMAAVYMLSGLLPPPILLRQKPSWEGVDQAQAGMTGEIKVWPGRIVMDTLWFAITRVHLRKPKPRTPPDRVARTPELTEPK